MNSKGPPICGFTVRGLIACGFKMKSALSAPTGFMEQFFDQTFKPGISDFLNFLIAVLMGSSLGHEAPQLGALSKNAEVPKPLVNYLWKQTLCWKFQQYSREVGSMLECFLFVVCICRFRSMTVARVCRRVMVGLVYWWRHFPGEHSDHNIRFAGCHGRHGGQFRYRRDPAAVIQIPSSLSWKHFRKKSRWVWCRSFCASQNHGACKEFLISCHRIHPQCESWVPNQSFLRLNEFTELKAINFPKESIQE